jgi:hypothetical protein
MHCERCDGLMVTEMITDMNGTTLRYEAWRCLLCGNVSDSRISEHRMTQRSGAQKVPEHRRHRKFPVRSVLPVLFVVLTSMLLSQGHADDGMYKCEDGTFTYRPDRLCPVYDPQGTVMIRPEGVPRGSMRGVRG